MDWNQDLKSMFESFKLGFQSKSDDPAKDSLLDNASHVTDDANSLIAVYTIDPGEGGGGFGPPVEK